MMPSGEKSRDDHDNRVSLFVLKRVTEVISGAPPRDLKGLLC